jgi:hypothetical protein
MISRGSVQLARLCEPHGQVTAIATTVGAAQSLVSRWAAGTRVPSSRWRAKMQDELGIDWRAWDEPADDAERAAS